MKKLIIATLITAVALTPISTIAFAAPSNWTQKAVEKVHTLDVAPKELFDDNKFQENATLDELSITLVNLLEKYVEPKTNSSSTTPIEGSLDSDAILRGIQYGIISCDNFNPKALVTREQAVVMMANTLKQLNVGLVKVEGKFFLDHDKISSWAVEDINSMFISGVINIAGNQFNPQSNLTRDQLFVMVSDLDTFLQAIGFKYRTGVQQVVETPTQAQAQKEVEPTTKVEETKPVEEPQRVTFNNVTINIGDTQETVESKIGKADRKGASQFNFEWNIYNSDPTMLTMIGYIDNKVAGIYHMSKVFTSSNGNYGDKPTGNAIIGIFGASMIFKDQLNDGITYAVLLLADNEGYIETNELKESNTYFNDFAKNQLDVANVFRNWNDVQPLIWDDSLASVAQAHSQDMADRNYFNHTTPDGITASDRIKSSTKYQNGWGENISQRTFNLGLDGFMFIDQWINSQGHRENLLRSSFNYFGSGCASKLNSAEVYSTQNFAR